MQQFWASVNCMLPKRYNNIIFKMMCNVLLPQPWQSLWVHPAYTGDTHEYLALASKRYCISGHHSSKTIRETVSGRLPTPEHWTHSKLAYPQSSCEKGLLSWSYSRRYRLQVYHTSGGYGSAFGKGGPWDSIFVLVLGLPTACQYLPERSSYTHQESQFLQLLLRGHLQITWCGGQ